MSRVKVAAAVVVAVFLQAPADAQDRVIGLLKLPEVFSTGPCVPFFPRTVELFDQPDGKAVGTVEVDQNWSFAPHGGCEGLEVRVHQGDARRELPTREYDYEAPAAIALEQRGSWFRIRVSPTASAWVRSVPDARFMTLESLFEEFIGVTFIADTAIRELSSAPATSSNTPGVPIKAGLPVQVLETTRAGDRLWLRVEVFSHSLCTAGVDGPPDTVGRGWLPAHSASGEPAVWFASRGC